MNTVILGVFLIAAFGAGFWLGWQRALRRVPQVQSQELSSDGKAQAELILCQARVVALERRLGERAP